MNKEYILVQLDYSGGSNTEQVRYSDGPKSFGSGPNHSKTEHG